MKPILQFFAPCLTLLAIFLTAQDSFGYDQAAAGLFGQSPDAPAANTNAIEVSASSAPNDVTTFSNAVTAAWATDSGGVYSLTNLTGNPTLFRATYGSSKPKRLTVTTSATMQSIGWPPAGSFNPLSYDRGACQSGDSTGYSLAIGAIDNPATGLRMFSERVSAIGLGILSRTHSSYPCDIRVTAAFSDGTTEAVTSNLGNPRGTDDTFFGFTAPSGKSITNLLLESFTSGTTTPKSTRIAWDDLGFITTPTGLPDLAALSPTNSAMSWASNGVQFQLNSSTAIDPDWISVTLNSSNVTSQLVITGEPTNRLVSFNGLEDGAHYLLGITVTNAGGTATWTSQFYTPDCTVYDSHGFTDDVLYPVGPLQGITDGWATWTTNATLPASITDLGPPQGKVQERMNNGVTLPDYLDFPPVASGTLIVDFDVMVSSTITRTLDVALLPVGYATMASLLTWNDVTQPGKLSYYNNTAYVPLMDWASDQSWHHCKVIHYLSGPAAGRYDVVVDGTTVGLRIPWRNAPLGSAFSRLRLESVTAGGLLDYSRVDNLVVTAVAEDPNAFISPTISNLTPANGEIVRPAAGVHFEVTSGETISASDIAMELNGSPVSLVVTGAVNHYYATYDSLTEGNHSAVIYATNSLGTTILPFAFIATDEAWLPHPADGWAIPWQWTVLKGERALSTASPIDGAGPYLHQGTNGNQRVNSLRQYQSGTTVDITKPHYVRWKFRLAEAETDFAAYFTDYRDRVHFFAVNAPRLTASTSAEDSWSIFVWGAESASYPGACAGQTFWLFDNLDGTPSNFALTNLVDSHIQLFPNHIYAFEVLVRPDEQTYTAKIVDETSASSFASAPLHFRAAGVTATSHTLLHFGVQSDVTTDVRPYDLDSVFITQALVPVTLLNPARAGSTFTFSFLSQAGHTNVVEYCTQLPTSTWTQLETIPGDGTLKTATDPNASDQQRYYRVRTQ